MEHNFYVPGGQPPTQDTSAPEMPPPPTKGERIFAERIKRQRELRRIGLFLMRPLGAMLALLLSAFVSVFVMLTTKSNTPETKTVSVRSHLFKVITIDGRPLRFHVLTAYEIQHYPRERDSKTGFIKAVELLGPTEVEGDIHRLSIRGNFPLLIKGNATEVDIVLQGQQPLMIAGDVSGARTPSWVATSGKLAVGGNINGGVTAIGCEITYGGAVDERTRVQEYDNPWQKHVGPWNGRKAALQWPG